MAWLKYPLWVVMSLLLIMVASLKAAVKAADTIEIIFGVYESERASEMYRAHESLVRALEASLTKRLKTPVKVTFRITRSYQDLIDQLVRGELDIARVGAATMILVQRENPDVHLLAEEQKTVQNSSLIIVSKSSGIDRLEDLRGQRFAFSSHLSTEGRYLAQAQLLDAGIGARDMAFDYLGRHDKVLKAVQLMDYTAGAIKSCVYEKNQGDKTLRILARIPSYSKIWLGSAMIEPALAETIREVLLEMEPSDAMNKLEINTFTPVNRERYQDLEVAIKQARYFGGNE